jgi:hypothetical protein
MRQLHPSEIADLPEGYQPIEYFNLEPRSVVLTIFYWLTIPITLLLVSSYFLSIYDQILQLRRSDLNLGISIQIAILLIMFVIGLLHALCHAFAIWVLGSQPRFLGRTKDETAKRLQRLQITLVQLVWTPYRALNVLQFAWVCLAPGIILTFGATMIMFIARQYPGIIAWAFWGGVFHSLFVHADLWLVFVALRHGPQARIVDTEEGTIIYWPENRGSK